jgi:hypothetical protein
LDGFDQRHIAPICASPVRTTYGHRTCRRAGHAQALGVADLRPWRGIDGSTDATGVLWLSCPGLDPAISLLQDSKDFGERMTLSVGISTTPSPKSNEIAEAQI